VHLVANGVDCARYAALPTGRHTARANILFIGTLSWPPNAAAVRFLAAEVLPSVQARIPGASLTVVGRDPGADLRRLADRPHVTIAENVPDILPYLHSASVLAVPLEAGGGTRLKILEAFAAGLPVVSTPIGCEGLAGIDGRDLLVVDRSRFAETLCDVLDRPDLGERLAASARPLVRARYDWSVIGSAAADSVASILQSR
jgi:glycosyltransferase involved in cell wall biosynthesis